MCSGPLWSHARGLVHMDVKPSTIMWRPGGGTVLIDHHLVTDCRLPTLPQAGTPGFMAPEVEEGCATGTACDVFSMGRTISRWVLGGAQRARHSHVLSVPSASAHGSGSVGAARPNPCLASRLTSTAVASRQSRLASHQSHLTSHQNSPTASTHSSPTFPAQGPRATLRSTVHPLPRR
mmetsp:Transcript_10398/g.24409  ORF Transcript_10398/g.24409 Transcript_10398/m.24409 type:complete len:178 (+) Transcript_10398:105-638(+)